jgi:hypothetical protein
MFLPLLLLSPLSTAQAADITDQPDFLKGNASLVTHFSSQSFGLDEAGEDVGGLSTQAQNIGFRAEFGAGPGTSVFLEFSTSTKHEFSYTDPRSMGWNPNNDEGSLAKGQPIAEGVDPITGSGFQGVWMGVRGTPISQARGARATWLIEGALRTPDATNIYTGDGAGEGGLGLRLANVFSTSRGGTHPYISAIYTNNKAFTASPNGAAEVELDPANTIDMVAGAEFDTWADVATGRALSLEGRVFFGYNSPGIIPSGLLLAQVLPGTENNGITTAEYSAFGAGFGLHYRPIREIKIDLNVDLAWPTPHRLEHPYPVSTSLDSRMVKAGLAITYLYR